MAELIVPYFPRPLQQDLHQDPTRFKVLVCHRRFGKTVWAINQSIARAIACYGEGKKKPRVAYIAPLLKQARTVAWDYAKEYLSTLPGFKPNEGNLHIDFLDGCRLTLYGSDNPDAARGIYLDDVVMDEYAQMSPKMWSEIIRPVLRYLIVLGQLHLLGRRKVRTASLICLPVRMKTKLASGPGICTKPQTQDM